MSLLRPGHYYGTPLPLSNPTTPTVNGQPTLITPAAAADGHNYSNAEVYELNAINNNNGQPTAAQLSMAAKRKRNRSNIAAIDASSLPHGKSANAPN